MPAPTPGKEAMVVDQEDPVKDEPIHHEYASGAVVLTQGSEIQKIPQPSASPNDPLNWPKWRKLGLIFTCCWFSLFSLVLVGGVGPFLETLIREYASDHSVQEVVGMSTYPSLVMALGNLLILPAALAVGRRPILLLCIVLLLGSTIGAATSKSFETHLACRILQGIATGATESLLPLMITEVTFLHERDLWFGVYWGSQSTLNAAFLIADSYLVAATSWRWFYGMLAIAVGVALIITVLGAPETRFQRGRINVGDRTVYTDEFGVTHVVEPSQEGHSTVEVTPETRAEDDAPMTFLETLKPFQGFTPNALRVFLHTYVQLGQVCLSPGIIFAVLLSSISLGIGIAISLTYSTVIIQFYHWDPSSVGLMNIGVIPAALMAIVYAGYGGDKALVWLAKRNNGIHMPEHQLLLLIFPTIIGVAGVVLYGVTAGSPDDISVWGVIMGWALEQFSFVATIIITTAYAAEAMPGNPGAALILVIGAKNVVSFGASYGLTPMVARFGYRTSHLILVGIYLGIAALGVPIYMWRVMRRPTILN